MEEVFKDIIWLEWLYQISNLWNVKSFNYRRTKKHKILKNLVDKKWKWYNYFNFRWKKYMIHRTVMKVFVWDSKLEVNHIDWNPKNNNLTNLEYCTHKQNMIHSTKILWNKTYFQTNHPDKWKFWKDNRKSKKVNQYDLNGNLIKEWFSLSDIHRELKYNISDISACCRKLYWHKTCGGFIWKFNLN